MSQYGPVLHEGADGSGSIGGRHSASEELCLCNGCHVIPRPDLHKSPDDEADQHQHRLPFAACQQPVEELGECQDADDAADSEHGQDGDVQIAHGLHHIVVFSEDDQDEAARDARQNHGAYGDCTAYEDEPEPVRSIRGRHCADDYAESDTYNEEEIVEKFPSLDVSNHVHG